MVAGCAVEAGACEQELERFGASWPFSISTTRLLDVVSHNGSRGSEAYDSWLSADVNAKKR